MWYKVKTLNRVHDAKSIYHQRKSMGVIINSIWCDVFVHYKY